MPRYFFHLPEGERLFPDHKGEELPNDEAAVTRLAESQRSYAPAGQGATGALGDLL